MRIGLVGGMANAMYCFTRLLRKQGYDAYYVEDEQDTFPMSQPLWEEVPLQLDWSRFGAEPLDPEAWSELAESTGWRAPDWVVRPGSRGRVGRVTQGLRRSGRDSRARLAELRELEPMAEKLRSEALVAELASYDRLVACGMRVVEALFSARPYVFWPHGGDVHLVPFRADTPLESAFSHVLREAVIRADVAGTHDPTIAARLEELGRAEPIPYLPFVVDVEVYAPGEPESALAKDVRVQAGDRRILLLASRQDFYWKGTDRFARAFAATVAGGAPLYLVVSPWGADVEATRQMFADAGVLDSVHYLETAVSKPILRDLYRISDAVVDQFTVTAFGAVMLEAMACGAPVLINLDLDAFASRWPGYVPPPTLRASTEEEIAAVLRGIADGSTAIDELARAGREWVEEHHGPDKMGLYAGEAP